MLSPHPLSLFCALLLCLPLALVFTTTPRLSITISTSLNGATPVVVTLNRRLQPVPVEESRLAAKPPAAAEPEPAKPQPPPTTITRKPSIIPPVRVRRRNPDNRRKPGNESTPRPRPEAEPAPEPLQQLELSPPPLPPPPPSPPVDDAHDVRLFRRASKVSPHADIPYPGAPRKIAFMFLTTTPLPFAPLWEQFFAQAANRHSKTKSKSKSNPYYNIYIHADPTYNYTPPFTGVFANRVITPFSKPTHRNTPTLASAARRLLAYALIHDPANHIFVLLSSTCIPLHSFHFTQRKLTSPRNLSFIEILANETGAYERWAARGDSAMLPEVPFDKFRIGSQFWALTRRHARAVVRDANNMWRKFKLDCVRLDTCYPEENYFPTLVADLNGDSDGAVVPATLTNVDWSGSFDGHPRMYNQSEVDEELIRRLRSRPLRYDYDIGDDGGGGGGNGTTTTTAAAATTRRGDDSSNEHVFLFARKFAPECLAPLMNVSSHLIFKD